jgi:Ras-related protein Rab-1A
MIMDYDYIFKILLVGDSSVGKTSIATRFADNEFSPNYISTIGVDFKIKTLNFDGKKFKITIFDTAGQERFRTITSSYYRGGHGIILAYDITDIYTFNNIPSWMKEIRQYANDSVKIVLVGNKSDLEKKRIISYKEGEEMAKNLKIQFIETSAFSNTNINNIFTTLITEIKDEVIKNELKVKEKSSLNIDKTSVISFKFRNKCCS